jgi:hypothetical protein
MKRTIRQASILGALRSASASYDSPRIRLHRFAAIFAHSSPKLPAASRFAHGFLGFRNRVNLRGFCPQKTSEKRPSSPARSYQNQEHGGKLVTCLLAPLYGGLPRPSHSLPNRAFPPSKQLPAESKGMRIHQAPRAAHYTRAVRILLNNYFIITDLRLVTAPKCKPHSDLRHLPIHPSRPSFSTRKTSEFRKGGIPGFSTHFATTTIRLCDTVSARCCFCWPSGRRCCAVATGW